MAQFARIICVELSCETCVHAYSRLVVQVGGFYYYLLHYAVFILQLLYCLNTANLIFFRLKLSHLQWLYSYSCAWCGHEQYITE
jgi:hypothetical protein